MSCDLVYSRDKLHYGALAMAQYRTIDLVGRERGGEEPDVRVIRRYDRERDGSRLAEHKGLKEKLPCFRR